jgi:hypothetical protein
MWSKTIFISLNRQISIPNWTQFFLSINPIKTRIPSKPIKYKIEYNNNWQKGISASKTDIKNLQYLRGREYLNHRNVRVGKNFLGDSMVIGIRRFRSLRYLDWGLVSVKSQPTVCCCVAIFMASRFWNVLIVRVCQWT